MAPRVISRTRRRRRARKTYVLKKKLLEIPKRIKFRNMEFTVRYKTVGLRNLR